MENMDIKDIAGQLVKTCLKKGADAAEVYIESGRNLSLAVRKGDIETVEEAASSGVSTRWQLPLRIMVIARAIAPPPEEQAVDTVSTGPMQWYRLARSSATVPIP